jgi:hypothetical protein
VTRDPDPKHISTSYVERQNLTMRMLMRRFTRLTNAFSKKVENHAAAVALYFMYYNVGRVHQTLRVTPAMEQDSPTMPGPSKNSSPSSGKPENVLVYVERLRQQAEEFQRTVEEELRTTRALLEELLVRQAKRRGHGSRN